jgi:uncharacterized membrane-anchored protein YhcB (DUF1043 family)
MKNLKTAQSVLEYSLLIAIIVGAALAMQAYIKRSMQGQIQMTTDQLAEQYAPEETRLHEHFESSTQVTDWKLPYPRDVYKVKGSFKVESNRELQPLPTN